MFWLHLLWPLIFYGGVIELTGSDAFKQKAMQLIIEHNIKVRMKFPDQRAALEKLRKEKWLSVRILLSPISQHRNLTGIPPEQPAVPDPVKEKEATQSPASPVAPEASTVSTVPASSPAEPRKTADAAQGEEPPENFARESVTAVLHNFGRAEYAPGKGESFFVELKNRSGSKLYWGEQLESLVKKPPER